MANHKDKHKGLPLFKTTYLGIPADIICLGIGAFLGGYYDDSLRALIKQTPLPLPWSMFSQIPFFFFPFVFFSGSSWAGGIQRERKRHFRLDSIQQKYSDLSEKLEALAPETKITKRYGSSPTPKRENDFNDRRSKLKHEMGQVRTDLFVKTQQMKTQRLEQTVEIGVVSLMNTAAGYAAGLGVQYLVMHSSYHQEKLNTLFEMGRSLF